MSYQNNRHTLYSAHSIRYHMSVVLIVISLSIPVMAASHQKQLIIDINHLTYTIANQHDQFYSFIGVRTLALVHLAIHDIYQAYRPQFETYLLHVKIHADFVPEAAAIAAVQYLLTEIYPDRRDTIMEVCEKWVSSLGVGKQVDQGVRFGESVATLYLMHRADDGHDKNGAYTPMTKPGDYQYTPGFDYVWKPDFSVARPFTLDSVDQFRCPPPPELDSERYAQSYREVMRFGEKGSSVRSKDQTSIGHWWAEFGEHSWNRIGRIIAETKDLTAVEVNRMFALLNMNLYDLYLVSFDSKYHFDTWRPYTAIRRGADDGNDQTPEQTDWEPDMTTPPWPEYPSAHAAVGAAGAEIISAVLGTNEVSFSMKSTTALPDYPERTYHDLDLAANDCANSRIYNGYHFRFATEEGKNQGRKVARHTLEQFLSSLP